MKINVIGGELDRRELDEYIAYAHNKYRGRQICGTDFQRAYRSADYLVNDMEKLNDAKQKEFSEKERHKVEG